MTRLRLSDGVDLQVDLPLAEVQEALQRALAEMKMLEVTVDGNQVVVVNPSQVLYLADATVASAHGDSLNGSTPNGSQARRLSPAPPR
jgi:hypothetical protein